MLNEKQAKQPIAQFECGKYRNFVYLIIDWKTRQAAIVDPQEDLEPIFAFTKENDLRLAAILLTHTHFDHTAGLPELLRLYPELPLFLHNEGLPGLEPPIKTSANIRNIKDGEQLYIGSMSVDIIHTPGHTSGGCCFRVPSGDLSYLLTGDTLFIRTCGRTDLETGSTQDMFNSLQKIKAFSDSTIIYPGHHYEMECSSTLRQELLQNPSLQCKTVEELDALP